MGCKCGGECCFVVVVVGGGHSYMKSLWGIRESLTNRGLQLVEIQLRGYGLKSGPLVARIVALNLGQKWSATAGTNFTKPGDHF